MPKNKGTYGQDDYLNCKDDYLNCGDDYLNCSDDYLNCGDDDYLNCGSDDVPIPGPNGPPIYQPPRKDNWLAEIFYTVITFINTVVSWFTNLFRRY